MRCEQGAMQELERYTALTARHASAHRVASNPARLALPPRPARALVRSVPLPFFSYARSPHHRNCPASAVAARARSSSPRRLGDAPVGDLPDHGDGRRCRPPLLRRTPAPAPRPGSLVGPVRCFPAHRRGRAALAPHHRALRYSSPRLFDYLLILPHVGAWIRLISLSGPSGLIPG